MRSWKGVEASPSFRAAYIDINQPTASKYASFFLNPPSDEVHEVIEVHNKGLTRGLRLWLSGLKVLLHPQPLSMMLAGAYVNYF